MLESVDRWLYQSLYMDEGTGIDSGITEKEHDNDVAWFQMTCPSSDDVDTSRKHNECSREVDSAFPVAMQGKGVGNHWVTCRSN